MKTLKLAIIIFFYITLYFNSYSQGNFITNFGFSVPILDYGSDDITDENAGGARTGFGFGLQYNYPIGKSGLEVFGSANLFYNGIKKSVKDQLEDLFEQEYSISGANIKWYKMINVPISVGLNYTYESTGKFDFFLNGGLTYNFLLVTDLMAPSDPGLFIETEGGNSFGFKAGAGLLIYNNTSISINYLGLGKYDLNTKTVYEYTTIDAKIEQEVVHREIERKVDMITIMLGYKF